MGIKDYIFNVGERVITTEGETGRITYVCTCDNCKSRGFHEVFWIRDDDMSNIWDEEITCYQAKNGFKGYYQIGEYRFNDLDKEKVITDINNYEYELKRLRKQLRVIEMLEVEYGEKISS